MAKRLQNSARSRIFFIVKNKNNERERNRVMFFKNFSRRGLVLGLGSLGLATLGRSVNAQSLSASKSGTNVVSIVADYLANLVWELQKSTDGGVTWTTIPSTQGQTRWDIPISTETTTIFRLKLVTTATMTMAGVSYQFTPSVQSLYTVMTGTPNLVVKSQTYGFGQFVTELNGTVKGGGKNWILFVNGTSATTGSSNYTPKVGDKIEWRLV